MLVNLAQARWGRKLQSSSWPAARCNPVRPLAISFVSD